MRKETIPATFFLVLLVSPLLFHYVAAWSNGGYSDDPSNPDYGTHDWIAEHALDWLPDQEKQYILGNLAAYLYGTELPDNGAAPDGIGDVVYHHIYYNSSGTMTDDSAAVRAASEYDNALDLLKATNYTMTAKTAGVMSHYIVDVAVFGHVMGSGTDWGPEAHHSDYETYVNERTSGYSGQFNSHLSFDGSLDAISAYDAAKNLAYDTTFDIDGDLTCVWMDQNYNWSDPTFVERAGESLNLAVNYLTDVLHTLFSEAFPLSVTIRVPRDYATVQEALDAADERSTIQVEHGTYDPFVVNKSLTIIGESTDNTIIDGKGTGTVISITADNVYVRGFKVQNGIVGIGISNSKGNVVISNVITNNDRGILLSNSTENTVTSNTIRDNEYGIALDLSNRNIITRNAASQNIYGIDVRYSQNNTIACNNLVTNTNDGLLLYQCTQNSLTRNIMRANGRNGIYLQHCLNNILSHNNFVNNTNQLYQYDSSDIWFSLVGPEGSTPHREGNYWSDYVGADMNGDGIGDTLLPHQSIDNYPLVNPWSPYPTACFTCNPLIQRVNTTVTFNASSSHDEDGSIASFAWDFGDNDTATLKDNVITHEYVRFGNYTVTLTVIDNDALTSFSTAHVTIYSTPTASFTSYPESPIVGQTITFNASLSTSNGGNIASYSWDFENDSIADANGMIVTHKYSSPGTFTVILVITNTGGLNHTSVANVYIAATTLGFFEWLQSPTGIAALTIGIATPAIGVPLILIKKRKPSPGAAPSPPSLPSPVTLPPPPRMQEKIPKAVFTVSKANGEFTVMLEGPETQPIKLKHQLKIDEAMKRNLVQDFNTTALIANYWHSSRSGERQEKPPQIQTLDLVTHLQNSGRLMYRYLTPPHMGRFFKSANIGYLWLEIDENLLEIPWELMHDGEDFLCLKYAVGRRILTQQIYEAKPPRIADKPHFLLIGDPSEELPEAKREIQLLEKQLSKLPKVNVDTFIGSEITKRDFLQMLSEGRYDCIHFAGHAGFDVQKPDESYLKFGDASCYAFETKRLIDEENPPEIVFVNACSSAKEEGQTTFEKEIGGLARSFLFKGSMGYIGALWPVHDEAVAQFSISLYTKLVSGLTIGEALRQARKESFLAYKEKEIAWASFTLYGDPTLKLF